MIDVIKLDNGLRIVNEYMDEVESVSVHVWVKTGSENETKNINGISHFIEHMAFKGTKTRNVKKIAEEFDNIGGRVNAFTSLSVTGYYTKILKDHIEKAVELLADIFQNSILLEEEIEKERQVILQEYAMGRDDPTDLIEDYFNETCYANQAYGRKIIGTKHNIKKFTRNDLLKYINEQYKTEDIVISFAGNIKTNEAVKLVNKYFNNLNCGKNKNHEDIKYTGGYLVKNKKLEQTQILFGFETYSIFSEHYYELQLLSIILGGGISSRLFQEIREKKGLCYTINSFNSSNDTTGVLEIYSAVSSNKINETIISVIEEIKKLTENITEEEFDRALVLLKSNLIMNREKNSLRAKKNANNILFENRIISIDEIKKELNNITINNLKNLLIEILNNANPSIAILGKENQDILSYNDIKNKIKF